jgi:SAM-dependent methyltransferase
MKEKIKNIPILGNLATQIYWKITGQNTPQAFAGSEKYWEDRYAAGGNSGVGSYDKFAEFKASILNEFVIEHDIKSVIELGCGDGNQLQLANYPSYIGFDISHTVIAMCEQIFADDRTKTFKLMSDYAEETSDLALSLDVIYHLVEDRIFEGYIQSLFKAATRYVIIYSNNSDDNAGQVATHVRNRNFSNWIEANLPEWKLQQHIPNKYPYQDDYKTGSFADFYIYEKT